MKKKNLLFKCLAIGFFVMSALIYVGCDGDTGPAGPAGADGVAGIDGIDGVDGSVTCLDCHSGETKSSIDAQFAMSVHSSGINAVDYAGGRASCAECHSHQGFVQYANTGAVAGDITNPTAWECATCHGLHKTMEAGDYALRLSDPVIAIFDETVTMDLGGSSNLCANCHQSRRGTAYDMAGEWVDLNGVEDDGPGGVGDDDEYEVQAGEFFINSTHYGPHHGAQANVVYGAGFAEIAGTKTYPAAGSAGHLTQASCVGCHMAEFDDDKDQGGHTYNPSLNACNTCHGVTETDFDYGDVQTNIEAQLIVLREELIRLGVVEFAEETVWELDEETGNHVQVTTGEYEPIVGIYPVVQAQAFFNWIGLQEDRSKGAHNPKYVEALLQNTIETVQAIATP